MTGERADLSESLAPLVAKMRASTRLPLAAGFGISTPEQAGAVAKMADGVVVGSAIVRLIEQGAQRERARILRARPPARNGRMTQEEADRILGECRKKIDGIDLELLKLLNQRASIVEEIVVVKNALALAIFEPKREDAVFENVTSHNTGPLTSDALQRVFSRIMDEMRSLQWLRRHQQQGPAE